jgi:nitrous oxidase accessory protein NosD
MTEMQTEIIDPEFTKMVKTIKKYKTKNGEETIKVYNQKNYNDAYYKKNIDKFKETYKCELCNKNIIKANKFNHERTKGHILYDKYKINIKNL